MFDLPSDIDKVSHCSYENPKAAADTELQPSPIVRKGRSCDGELCIRKVCLSRKPSFAHGSITPTEPWYSDTSSSFYPSKQRKPWHCSPDTAYNCKREEVCCSRGRPKGNTIRTSREFPRISRNAEYLADHSCHPAPDHRYRSSHRLRRMVHQILQRSRSRQRSKQPKHCDRAKRQSAFPSHLVLDHYSKSTSSIGSRQFDPTMLRAG